MWEDKAYNLRDESTYITRYLNNLIRLRIYFDILFCFCFVLLVEQLFLNI